MIDLTVDASYGEAVGVRREQQTNNGQISRPPRQPHGRQNDRCWNPGNQEIAQPVMLNCDRRDKEVVSEEQYPQAPTQYPARIMIGGGWRQNRSDHAEGNERCIIRDNAGDERRSGGNSHETSRTAMLMNYLHPPKGDRDPSNSDWSILARARGRDRCCMAGIPSSAWHHERGRLHGDVIQPTRSRPRSKFHRGLAQASALGHMLCSYQASLCILRMDDRHRRAALARRRSTLRSANRETVRGPRDTHRIRSGKSSNLRRMAASPPRLAAEMAGTTPAS